MTDSVVAEGQVKFRDGKKWKTRWVVLRKPSPVADCLSLLVYKDKKKTKDKEKSVYHKERLNAKIEAICGLEPGPGYDGVPYSLSILCLAYSVALGFHSCEAQAAWEARVRYSLGEVHRFSVQVQPGTKLETGPASLHLCNTLLVLTRNVPPIVIGHWKLSELRRYGAVPDGFVFEGGSRCGVWSGVFYLSSAEGEQISFHLDCIARGVSPSRGHRGPRPPLPGDPTPSSSEERINQEALELEKRLSRLSHCSRPCSPASTYSGGTVAGDDHSSLSSSSSSQSDSSFGSRLLVWAEPTTARSRLSNETSLSSSSTLKALLTSADSSLYSAAGATRPLANQEAAAAAAAAAAAHGLHDSGRQSSLDSGIGIASCSQSSGSSSSFAGSLDAAGGSQAGGEDFGSLASLPFASSRPTSPLLHALLPSPPPSLPPPPPTSPLGGCAGPVPGSASRASAGDTVALAWLADEYRVPAMLRPCYDTPRSLLRGLALRDGQARDQGGPRAAGGDRRGGQGGDGRERGLSGSPARLSLLWARAQHRASVAHSHSWGSGGGRCPPRPLLLAGCPLCGGTQCAHTLDNYIIPERWQCAGGVGRTQVSNYFQTEMFPAVGGPNTSEECWDGASPTSQGRRDVGDPRGLIKLLMDPERSQPCLGPGAPTAQPQAPRCYKMPTPRLCHGPPDGMCAPAMLRGASTANYVNVPMSPAVAHTRRALLNMELHMKPASTYPAQRPSSALRGGSVRYTHLDMAAMETGQGASVVAHGQRREVRRSFLDIQ